MASTIKVDNVQNQPGTNIVSKCGTDVTLGASGDTVALACGASQTGFGRTGTVDWITTPKVTGDSPITGVTGKGYFLNTTAGAITLNLPAGAAGSIVSLADYAGTWQTNNVTVTPNGSEKIGGTASSSTLSTEGQSVTFVYVDSTQGWINTMDSTSNVRGETYMTASVSGACNTLTTVCTNYKVAKFLGPGTFCVSAIGNTDANNLVSYVVSAGGAGGGYGAGAQTGAGGGAGGFREVVSPTSPYTGSPIEGYPSAPNRIIVTATGYPIVVGGGGAAAPGTSAQGTPGVNSTFDTITSAGGGGGGSPVGSPIYPGLAGGSGGGGASEGCGSGGAGDTPPTTPAQGFAGGTGTNSPPDLRSGGGGGATAVGTGGTPSPLVAGAGGAGATTNITGAPVGYSGGGGGGAGGPSSCDVAPGPASDGGGAGGSSGAVGVNGTINTGGGAGGGKGGPPGATSGGAGGSGIVIIRYRFQ